MYNNIYNRNVYKTVRTVWTVGLKSKNPKIKKSF